MLSLPLTNFASKLHLSLNNTSNNVFYSPYSIFSALGMCAEGAKGDTLNSISKLLGLPVNRNKRKDYILSLFFEKNSKFIFEVANAIWPDKSLKISPKYIKNVEEIYVSKIQNLDYQENSLDAIKIINEWCDSKTNHKIQNIVNADSVSKSTRLILTNAIYFLGYWKNKFNLTRYQDFYLNDDHVVQAPMMSQNNKLRYAKFKNYEALEVPYEGDELSMLILLPHRSKMQFINSDLSKIYKQTMANLSYEDVIVNFPKFEFKTQYNLKSTFLKMDANLAFSDQADFSGICKQKIFISDIVHKAYIKCNEQGTEAAAVTAVVMKACCARSPSVFFNANRPFIFLIHRPLNNQILFVGQVNNPLDTINEK